VGATLAGSETLLTGFGDLEADAQDVASNSAREGPGIPSDGPLMVIPDLMSPDDVIGARLTHVEKLRNGVVWLWYDVIH